jgi:hypothetical protein
MRKSLSHLVLGVLIATVGLTACGEAKADEFIPATYGADGQCYYVESEEEVRVLKDDGLCEQADRPVHAGSDSASTDWLLFYALYLNSPAYYNHYVPAATRTVYIERRTEFNRVNDAKIKEYAPRAKYKGNDGKIYTGNKVKPGQFGNGGKGFGGGTRKCSMGAVDTGGAWASGTTGGRPGGGGTRTTSTSGYKPKPPATKPRSGC